MKRGKESAAALLCVVCGVRGVCVLCVCASRVFDFLFVAVLLCALFVCVLTTCMIPIVDTCL